MGELSRVEHESLSGGFSNETFFGGFISTLRGLYMPAKAEQADGAHYNSMVNLLSSVGRQVEAVVPFYAYKDDADADDEFSLKAGAIDLGGLACAYAGETALGPLAVGVNYIWLVVAPTITSAVGGAWPSADTPHLRIGAIDMPASGPWLPQHYTPYVYRQAAVPIAVAPRTIRKDFIHSQAGAIALQTVPANALIVQATVVVLTAFNGAAPTLTVGAAGDADRLVEAADVDLKTAGHYAIPGAYKYAAQTALTGTYTADGSTAGSAIIVVEVV